MLGILIMEIYMVIYKYIKKIIKDNNIGGCIIIIMVWD